MSEFCFAPAGWVLCVKPRRPLSLPPPYDPYLDAFLLQILALEMHRGLRPLGAAALPPPLQQPATLPGSGDGGSGSGGGADEAGKGAEEGVGVEGSRAAAKAVEGFIRQNIEAYFGDWTSTYTLFSLDPRLVSCWLALFTLLLGFRWPAWSIFECSECCCSGVFFCVVPLSWQGLDVWLFFGLPKAHGESDLFPSRNPNPNPNPFPAECD